MARILPLFHRMNKYFAKVCPSCEGTVGLVIYEPNRIANETLVHGICKQCGYTIHGDNIPGTQPTLTLDARDL